MFEVDSRLIDMQYNDQAPPSVCLPSVYPMSSHVMKSPRPSPSIFAYYKQSKNGDRNRLGNKATFRTN